MGKFKVGDRVRVGVEDADGRAMRGFVAAGISGVVSQVFTDESGCGVYLDSDKDNEWGFSLNELATVADAESPTLRDQFAMAALTGLVSQSNGTAFSSDKESGATWAYDMAQAMMKAREAQK